MAEDSPLTPPVAPPLAPPIARTEETPAGKKLLLEFLAMRDHPCPGCGYNLRALTSTRCPECNQELTLSVSLLEHRLGAYLAAVGGPLAGAGMGVLGVCLVLFAIIRYGPPPPQSYWPLFGIPPSGLIVHGAILVLLVPRRGRVWFRALSPGRKASVIFICWLIPVLFIGWFMLSIP